MAENLIIGTAGHVDHGKTTLIKALTGENTDRLKEEQERGVSIDLGFSSLELEDDLQVGIIDVPGHEKFVKNMLSGAGGVDLGLLVIAADEAIMPQTKEHLSILNLLDVEEGIIAVTKEDLVEDEWLELVIEEIKDVVEGTFLEDAPIVPVSGVEKTGIEELKSELSELIRGVPDKNKEGNVYFPIDRVFSISGHGTVVTGTLIKGQIEIDDELTIYPSKLDARVRSLQVHEESVEEGLPGQRIGINLAGVDTDEVERGDVLATDESLVTTEFLDARLELLEFAPLVLQHGDRIRLHLGAKEVLGRVYLLDQDELYPGQDGLVQFRLEDTIVANFKERFILRRYSPMTTIGGGEILEPHPSRHGRNDSAVISALKIKEDGSSEERIELALKQADTKPLTIEELVTKTSLAKEEIKDSLQTLLAAQEVVELNAGQQSRWIDQGHYLDLKEQVLEQLTAYHQEYHLRLGIPKEELRTKLSIDLDTNEYDLLLDELKSENKIKEEQAKISLADFAVELDQREAEIKASILAKFKENKFRPPELSELTSEYDQESLAREICNLLITKGELVKIKQDLYFLKEAVTEAKEKLFEYLEANGQIDLGEFRDLLDSSRKYALPLLEHFDHLASIQREDNIRVLVTD